jgi:hypothetical protein
MLLNTGEDWQPEPEDIEKWKELYPAIDVDQELRAMEGWCDANPTKRKTARGIKRFVNSWLARAQDKGGSPMAKGSKVGLRSMTMEDMLSHDFMDRESYRDHCLQRYGQYYKDGERFTQ